MTDCKLWQVQRTNMDIKNLRLDAGLFRYILMILLLNYSLWTYIFKCYLVKASIEVTKV